MVNVLKEKIDPKVSRDLIHKLDGIDGSLVNLHGVLDKISDEDLRGSLRDEANQLNTFTERIRDMLINYE